MHRTTSQAERVMVDQADPISSEAKPTNGNDISFVKHYRRPEEHSLVYDPRFGTIEEQRKATTLLVTGLTRVHERLLEGRMAGLGYNCKALPTPDLQAFDLGKEYGNNGYCNPAYFTGGNVIKYLQGLEAGGVPRQEIIDKYAILTAGFCGPCRFGLYEGEMRLALRNAGFEGFRVELIKITGGLDQSKNRALVDMNLDFFLALLTTLTMGDVVRQLRYQVQPYELEPGKTERVLGDALEHLHGVLQEMKEFTLGGVWKKLVNGRKIEATVTTIAKFLNLIRSQYFTTALSQVRDRFNEVYIDRFRVRPVVKVIGEFSAALADGDMNFKMYDFLEEEGAEILLDPAVSSQLLLTLYQHKRKVQDRKGVYENGGAPPAWRLDLRLRDQLQHLKKVGALTFAEKVFYRECARYQAALGGTLHEITDIYELERLAEMFYNWRCCSGESHLEIGKNIYNHTHDMCHMVLSLKPFGCLPSTQSDGAQAAVVEKYKEMIFLSIETSGEGEILAHSRVQMALDTARERAEQEFERVLSDIGKNLAQLREYVAQHPELSRPIYPVPPRKGVVGRAALFALHVDDLIEGKAKMVNISQ